MNRAYLRQFAFSRRVRWESSAPERSRPAPAIPDDFDDIEFSSYGGGTPLAPGTELVGSLRRSRRRWNVRERPHRRTHEGAVRVLRTQHRLGAEKWVNFD